MIVRSDGSVSIYLILVISGILLLTSVLIDYARVAAFNKQLELAAESGIRSALSAYDGELYERYGLFGTGGSDRGELFAHAAEHNWPEDRDAFRMLDIRSEASHVNSYEVLGTHAVFKRQVLEEMKYKAPVDFALEVVSRFAPVAGAMKEASASVKIMEQVRDLYDAREKQLSAVLELQKKAAGAVSSEIGPLIPAGSSSVYGEGTAAGIAAGYGAYSGWIVADSTLKEGEKPKFTAQISSYRSNADSTASRIVNAGQSLVADHQRLLAQEAAQHLAEAERSNAAMNDVVRQMREEQSNTGYDKVGESGQTGSAAGGPSSAEVSDLNQARQAVEQLLLPESWFADYKDEINGQAAAVSSVAASASAFQSAVSSALSGGAGTSLSSSAESLRSAYEQYAGSYIDPGSVIGARTAQQNQRQSSDDERKQKEEEAKTKLGEVRGWISGISGQGGTDEQQKLFDELKGRYEANLLFNDVADSPSESAAGNDGDPNDAADSSMSAMGSIFSGMADMLDGIRDPLYINEYIVHRFNAFDPTRFKELTVNAGGGEPGEALNPEHQEVEYILYGFHNPAGNIAAAYGEIFAVRLAIRTMEGLIECKTLGNPLLVLAGAVLYGVEKSIQDMATLAEKGSTPLSKYVSVDLKYVDYLRLFLLLHGSSDKRVARTIAVIEQNTGMTLSRTPTGLSGELTASVNLWFLPGLIKGFAGLGIVDGNVKGGRYEATKTIGWSYG